ncbi:MAG: CP family cyanate transporter-like MFS transporter [Verrucomicrobiales bacterium]|jgi:CP family cyanate transporter-like MFS transporter
MKPSSQFWRHAVLIGGLLLVAANLRPAITAIGPLAERIRLDGLSTEAIGAMTTVPLILFGVVGLWAGWIGNRFGFARVLGAGLLLLAAGAFVRSAPDESGVLRLAGAVLIGSGIALGNVLLPGIVKSRYPNHVGILTSLYSTAMNAGAALGVALAVPFAIALQGGWNSSLAVWGVLALISLIIWAPQLFPPPAARSPGHPLAGIRALIRQPRAWQVTAYMGLQSMIFYSAVSWLPTVLQTRGMTESTAAGWVTALQVIGCAASLVAPTLAGRRASQSAWLIGCSALTGISLTGILFLPIEWTGIAVLGLGVGVNASFGLVLLLIAVRSHDATTAASLSSMAQAIGYVFAAPGPWFIGWLSVVSGSWNLPFCVIIGLTILIGFVGWYAGKAGTISQDSQTS